MNGKIVEKPYEFCPTDCTLFDAKLEKAQLFANDVPYDAGVHIHCGHEDACQQMCLYAKPAPMPATYFDTYLMLPTEADCDEAGNVFASVFGTHWLCVTYTTVVPGFYRYWAPVPKREYPRVD